MSVDIQVMFEIVGAVARLILASVFLIAGVPKLVRGKDLANTLRSLGIQSPQVVMTVRFAVPIAETVLGMWLIAGVYPVLASFAALTMLLSFTYTLVALRKRGDATCACFVWDDGTVGVGHVVRNVVLVTVAGFVATVTLLGWYAWVPVWRLPAQSAVVVAASVLFSFFLYAVIARSCELAVAARKVMAEST